ncbi:hypothetical protein B0H19DRAFT_1101206 [Mycena capillaripes]|nr:hypothetical protein B0H19DRAFT_1101206 [Mycena capillaripes]
MSQTSLSAEILVYRTCAVCYKSETKKVKFPRCGACKKPAYCTKECQRKDWMDHKKTCHLQAQNRESRPERGTEVRDMLSDIKTWFSKHTQLMIYAGTHAMQLHNPANVSVLKTHMLVIQLEPAPSGKRGDFVYKSIALRGMREYGLDDTTCAGLVQRVDAAAKDQRHSLTMYVRSGAAGYLAPITVQWCNAFEHAVRFGPPDLGWEKFFERAVNKTLEEGDRTRITRLQQLI